MIVTFVLGILLAVCLFFLILLGKNVGILLSFFNHTPIGLIIINEKKILNINPKAKQMLELTKKELTSTEEFINHLSFLTQKEIKRDNLFTNSSTKKYSEKSIILKKKNCEKHLLISCYSSRKKYLFLAQDITERVLLDQNLYKINLSQKKTRETNDHFLSNISHEIKTPLNAIIGFSEILNKKIKDSEQLTYNQTILKSGKNLLEMINNIIDISKIESKNLIQEYHPVDLLDIKNEISLDLTDWIQNKEVSFKIEIVGNTPNYFWFDQLRLKQLISNMTKSIIEFFSPLSLKLTILLNPTINPGISNLIISIKQECSEEQKKSFSKTLELFKQQFYHTQTSYKQNKINVIIIKGLLDLFNGKISFCSYKDQDQLLSITLPSIKTSIASRKPSSNDQEIDVLFNYPLVIFYGEEQSLFNETFPLFQKKRIRSRFIPKTNDFKKTMTRLNPDLLIIQKEAGETMGKEGLVDIKTHYPLLPLALLQDKDDQELIIPEDIEGILRYPISPESLLRLLKQILPWDTKESSYLTTKLSAMDPSLRKEFYLKLKDDFIPIIESWDHGIFINEVKDLVTSTSKFAEKKQIKLLSTWSSNIKQAYESFDILQINQKTMELKEVFNLLRREYEQ